MGIPFDFADIVTDLFVPRLRGWSFGCWLFRRMSHSAKFSRRKFMQITAAATAAGPMVSCLRTSTSLRCLSEDEARTLEALCDRIIPADQDPGAAWAGVVTFIDRQLAGPYRRFRKTYRLGLIGTDGTSLAMFGKPFLALTPQRQDTVLETIDKGQARGDSWKLVSAKAFFDLVVNHTKQGFYGDPRHGGNRERVSWKMLHLPYPPVRGRVASG